MPSDLASRLGELMWPPHTEDPDAPEGAEGTTAPSRPALLARLRELGISKEDAETIVERQREIDSGSRVPRPHRGEGASLSDRSGLRG